MTPLFSDKNKYKETIILTENSNVISDELKVAQTSNNYFANVAASLKQTLIKIFLQILATWKMSFKQKQKNLKITLAFL